MNSRFWHGLVTFGCAITIPDEEAAETRELLTSALIAASLGNDLFSYEKEYEDTMKAGLPDVVNAVWVIMGERGCSTEEAKEVCKERIRVENAKYVKVVEETRKRTDLSEDVRRYIEVMQYSLSGNLVWSIQCPRYNKGAKFNELQMLRAKHGLEKYPARWPPKDDAVTNGSDIPVNGNSQEKPQADGDVKEDGEAMYWGLNGVGVRVGNGVDEHGVGHYESSKVNGHANGNGHGAVDSIKTNGTNGINGTNGAANGTTNGTPKGTANGHANGTNGVNKPAHVSKPSTDSLVLEDVVSLALDYELPDLSDDVSLDIFPTLSPLMQKSHIL